MFSVHAVMSIAAARISATLSFMIIFLCCFSDFHKEHKIDFFFVISKTSVCRAISCLVERAVTFVNADIGFWSNLLPIMDRFITRAVTVFEQKVSQLHSFSAIFAVFKVSCVENAPKSVTAQDFMSDGAVQRDFSRPQIPTFSPADQVS